MYGGGGLLGMVIGVGVESCRHVRLHFVWIILAVCCIRG